jgi:purine-cytosine permease-like protein
MTSEANSTSEVTATESPSRDPLPSAQVGVIENRHVDYVPEAERHGKTWRQGPFWFLGNFQPFTVAIAFLGPAVGLNGFWTSVAGIAGILFGTMFMAAHAAQGPRLGLPQMIQSRGQFGYRGVILPVLATTFTFVAFNVVDVVIVKQGLHQIFGWDQTLVAVVITVVASLLAIYGHDWIHRVFITGFWVSLPFWILVTVGILTHNAGGHGALTGGFNVAGFFAMFAAAASYNITYAPYVSDYSRYLPKGSSQKGILAAVFFGASGSPIWLIPIGAWMATRLGVSNALSGIYQSGNNTVAHAGTVLLIIAVTVLVATMGISAYSGMLSVLTIIDSVHPVHTGHRVRVVTVVALAIVWFVLGLALSNATSVLNNSLIIMLYLLAPWTSVNLMDFYFVRHGKFAIADFFKPSGIYGIWGVRGIVSYLVGIAVEIPFMLIPGVYQSPGATWLKSVDISWIIGLFVAGGLYFILTRSLDVSGEAAAIERSDQMLRDGEVLR